MLTLCKKLLLKTFCTQFEFKQLQLSMAHVCTFKTNF